MPIRKFRSVAEMDEARKDLWCDELDGKCLQRIADLWERSSRISPRRYPKGIFKFRSLDEAQAHREYWIRENILRVQSERASS